MRADSRSPTVRFVPVTARRELFVGQQIGRRGHGRDEQSPLAGGDEQFLLGAGRGEGGDRVGGFVRVEGGSWPVRKSSKNQT